MNKRYLVKLDKHERKELSQLVKKERIAAKKPTHAQVLLVADAGKRGPAWKDKAIAEACQVTVQTVENIRKRLVLEGLESAVTRKKQVRPSRAKILDGEKEAQVVAVCCGAVLSGHARWTLRLLAERVVELDIVEAVSHETVRQCLKEVDPTLGGSYEPLSWPQRAASVALPSTTGPAPDRPVATTGLLRRLWASKFPDHEERTMKANTIFYLFTLILAVPAQLLADTPLPSPAEDHSEAKKQAVAAAESWLAQVDDGKYGDSWDAAADYLKNAVTKVDFVKSLDAVRKPLGKLQSREVQSQEYRTSLPGAPDGEYVVIQFRTVLENKKPAIETVTPMLGKDRKWKVSGYYVK